MLEHGLPRFVFVKSPVEAKPFYVDLDSTVLLRTFAKVVRKTRDSNVDCGAITVTEMYPDHHHLWLPDADDNRYTSELRMVLLDCLEPGI